MGMMLLWWLLGLVLVAAVVRVLMVKGTLGPFGSSGSIESPEQVVKRRYANGEIDRETYERMLADLKK